MSTIRRRRLGLVAIAGLLLACVPGTAQASAASHRDPVLVVSGLQTSTGSGTTIGPDGALYVTEGRIGRISRIDRSTGQRSTFADGLPTPVIPIGGVMDVAFRGHTAYAIVTNVGSDIGGTHTVGLYEITGPHSWRVVADVGAWNIAHPSTSQVAIKSGVLYAMQPYRDGFLVSDGHHNRVLRVRLDGTVSVVLTLGDVVPTGLDADGGQVYTALAGPVPHLPKDGRAIAYTVRHPHPRVVASGAPLLVDVELGHHGRLYGLAQGHFTPGQDAGAPADPKTGMLMRADHGHFVPVVTGLDRPTSFELTGRCAWVVTLTGQVWKADV